MTRPDDVRPLGRVYIIVTTITSKSETCRTCIGVVRNCVTFVVLSRKYLAVRVTAANAKYGRAFVFDIYEHVFHWRPIARDQWFAGCAHRSFTTQNVTRYGKSAKRESKKNR